MTTMAFIAKWLIVTMLAAGALAIISTVGKPRKPNTGGSAAVSVAIIALEILAIVMWWHV